MCNPRLEPSWREVKEAPFETSKFWDYTQPSRPEVPASELRPVTPPTHLTLSVFSTMAVQCEERWTHPLERRRGKSPLRFLPFLVSLHEDPISALGMARIAGGPFVCPDFAWVLGNLNAGHGWSGTAFIFKDDFEF